MAEGYDLKVEKNKIKNVKSLYKTIEKELDKISIFEILDNETQFDILSECVDKSIAATGLLKNMTDHVASENIENYCIESEKSLTMSKEGNLYKFVLNDLLPQRRLIKNSKDQIRYGSFKNYLSIGYREGLEEYLVQNDIIPFKDKVLACFINYYNESSELIDLDNLDQKPFIDICVSRVLVPDDSPTYISHLMLGQKSSGRSHTEVYIGNSSEIFELLKTLNITF